MWVVEMENKVDGAEPQATVQEWSKHCIIRVPPRFKTGKNVFKPQMVALGPFHHKDPALLPMEEHKLRAVLHLLRRAGKRLGHLAAAVEGVAANLEDAYAELGNEWRGENRDKFLEMMIADGCFLLEFMRNYRIELENPRKEISCDYLENDPVFGPHAVVHFGFFVQRDMLLIENQVPLILLRTIVAFEGGQNSDSSINQLVLHFLHQDRKRAAGASSRIGHGLHPLDLYRQSLLHQSFVPDEQANPSRHGRCCLPRQHTSTTTTRSVFVPMPLPPENKEDDRERTFARSAQKLYEAGIWFKRKKPDCIDNIDFNKGKNCYTLEMPRVVLDDSSEYKYRNLMAFEALHAGAGAGGGAGHNNEVTAFVLFMRDLVDSVADVDLLRRKGILDNHLAGGDWAVVRLLSRLTTDVAEIKRSPLCIVRSDMESYCVDRSWAWRVLLFKWWANLRTSHLANIWTFIALLAGIFLLGTDIVQTVYSVKSYVYAEKSYKLELRKDS